MWSLDPSDVLNIKIADYGISRFANPSGVKGQEGTPGYVAPEALRRRGEDQAFDEKVTVCGSLFVHEKDYMHTRAHTHMPCTAFVVDYL